MKLVYIAGPYSGNIKENVANALEVAKYYIKKGYNVFCPHIYYYQLGELEYNLIMEMCIDIMIRCDIVAFLPGWEKSNGAVTEYRKAAKLNKKIIYLTKIPK